MIIACSTPELSPLWCSQIHGVLVQQERIRAPVAPTQNQCGGVADARAGALTCPQGDKSQTHSQ
ncbi:hypothetical protein KDH_24770 [Dictyobacter sp. S3.2.2.5]|uniref:Uncharacterized protein n=1 Tax=Dictyobacter halimunensis TaxID=3026934 RepID=A0ABQ6FN02_9CHLR|nr:hypothetical protein KDH_24770 [Dictyobacter sp. S3.2.2.5]